MWREQSWLTIQQEFSDLGDAHDITRVAVRLIVAVALCSAIFVLIPLQGVAAGMGRETTAVVSAVFAFVILSLLRRKPAPPQA